MHIERLLDRIHAGELRGERDFIIPMREARAVHIELTKLLLRLEQHLSQPEEVIKVELTGSKF